MAAYRRRTRRYQAEWDWLKWAVISLIVIGAVAIGWRAYVMHTVTQMFEDIANNAKASSQHILQKERDRQASVIRQREEQARQEATLKAAQRQALRESAARAARKEAAWEKFFQPSAKCKADPVTVECANAYIRAKNKFEQSYTE